MLGKRWWMWIGLLALFALVLRSRLYVLFVVLLGIASGTSILWEKYCLHAVTYRRQLRDPRVFYGEETDLTIEVTNAKPLPLAWLLIRDAFPKNLSLLTGELVEGDGQEQQERAVVHLTDMLSLRWYERVKRTYRIRGDNRGMYKFGPVNLASGDLFGFGRKTETWNHQDRLIVYPRIVPVIQLSLPAERPSGEMKARRRIMDDPLRPATVREYVPGDSIRHIHWKNTARANQLQTKVFDPSASHVLALFADMQTVHNPYGMVSEYLELVISATASVAIAGLDQRYAVGLYANGGPRDARHWTIVPPGRSAGQATEILDALAPLFGFRLIPLHHLLRRSMPILPFGSTVVTITALATEELYAALLSMQDAGHPVVLLTVGDEKPQVPPMFTNYHLGGRDAWRHLEALELA